MFSQLKMPTSLMILLNLSLFHSSSGSHFSPLTTNVARLFDNLAQIASFPSTKDDDLSTKTFLNKSCQFVLQFDTWCQFFTFTVNIATLSQLFSLKIIRQLISYCQSLTLTKHGLLVFHPFVGKCCQLLKWFAVIATLVTFFQQRLLFCHTLFQQRLQANYILNSSCHL